MKKKIFVLLTTFLLSLVLTTTVFAAPSKVSVELNNNNGTQTSDITLRWTYTTGDRLYKSTDGITWTEVVFTNPGNGNEVVVVGATNIPYYSNIYFEVRDNSYSDASRYTNLNSYKKISVFPPNEHGHANFSNNTDTCRGCHSAHNATQAKLLRGNTVKGLCYICHGGAATGSKYNVELGAVRSNSGSYDAKALGGLFTTNPSSVWGNKPATSTHEIDNNNVIAPGGIGSGIQMTCTSCHTGHQSKNTNRLLNFNNAVEFYAINTTGTMSGGVVENPKYIYGLNDFCGNCHGDYKVGSGGGSTADGKGAFRHPVGVDITTFGGGLTTTLPLEIGFDGTAKKLNCMTCHYAHGTVAIGNNQSVVDRNNDTIVDNNDVSTVLKRQDNMAICQNCHKK